MFANKLKELYKLLECGETLPVVNDDKSRSLETYLLYLDANNLYGNILVYKENLEIISSVLGAAQTLKLPMNNFRFVDKEEIHFLESFFQQPYQEESLKDTKLFPEDTGFFLEVDLSYPEEVPENQYFCMIFYLSISCIAYIPTFHLLLQKLKFRRKIYHHFS